MDIRNYFLENKNLYSEEYLSALASKGLYKRALKDLEKTDNISWSIKEKEIEFVIGENTISLGMEKNNCSCISREMCRHILAAYIYLGNNLNEIFEVEASQEIEEREADFSLIEAYDYKGLSQEKSKIYLKALEKLKGGIFYEISEGKVVEVKSQDYKVVFFPWQEVKDGKCSCGARELCAHKVEALAFYRKYKGFEDEVDDLKEFGKKELKNFKLLSNEVMDCLEDIFKIGLIKYRNYYLLEQLSLKLRRGNMPDFERAINRILLYLDSFMKRKASFNINYFRREFLDFYEKIIVLRKAIDDENYGKIRELVGKFRDEYVYVGSLNLTTIGVETWKKNDYRVKNIYFLEEAGAIYNIGIYGQGASSGEIWNEISTNDNFEGRSFLLEDAYSSEKNKLSLTSKTKHRNTEAKGYKEILELHAKDNWPAFLEELIKDRKKTYIIKISDFGQGTFDKVRQEKIIEVEDKDGRELSLYIPYSKENSQAINYFENIEKGQGQCSYIFAKFYIEKHKIYMLPISTFYRDKKVDLRRQS